MFIFAKLYNTTNANNADAVIEVKEGNLAEATVEDDEIETMEELVKKEGVDKIERKPRQNNRRNNVKKEDKE